ncbi:glycoside hydrolase family 19 protein [Orbus sturtevantii]|uniref:glycoside hydrolase family 19 protein n=1 Tax=Orbus sturtevantii TaxID=3074109 RepID=UPI00370D5C4A
MTIKKVTHFIFPVGDKILSQDAYYRALSEAKNGFYPFSENGLWHGGIHIDDGVFKNVSRNDNMLRCMAQGEVIAYRVNSVYPKVTYEDTLPPTSPLVNGRERVAYFSTSFTLVRHYFAMPKVAGETDPPPSITLYSLYMHQLDWYGYQELAKEASLAQPQYWHLISGRVSSHCKDPIRGTIVRHNGAKTPGVALLLKGSKIKLGDQINKSGWYKLESIIEGGLVNSNGTFYADLVSITGYVFGKEIGSIESDPTTHKNTVYTVNKDNNDKIGSPEVSVAGITVYANKEGKDVLAYLPKETRFEFDGQEDGYAKIKKIQTNYIPTSLKVEGGATADSPHHGWVKVANLTGLGYEPKALDKVVVLDSPMAISAGDFIGYLGHNVSSNGQFSQAKRQVLATEKRPSNHKLTLQGHVELFTCDDLPAFITKTRLLADKLPESEKNLILVEEGAQLISESPSDGEILTGRYISLIGSPRESCYIQAHVYYVLNINRQHCHAEQVIEAHTLPDGAWDSLAAPQPTTYRLTAADKAQLITYYQFQYPELTVANIPDTALLIGYASSFSDSSLSTLSDGNTHHGARDEVQLRFSLVGGDSAYWVNACDVMHLQGGEGQLNQPIAYWQTFPLTLTNLPAADNSNTVYYPRTLPLASLKSDNHIAIDKEANHWAYITAGNQLGSPIRGWVNISKGATDYRQPHIKRVSPWAWTGYSTIKETANVANFVEKLQTNRKMTLDLNDYTESMSAMHHILTKTPLSKALPYVLPPFTHKQLQMGLQTPWTAELISRLAINYESEWYSDESLSKWNEIDELYQKQTEQKRQAIIDELTKAEITAPVLRQHACGILDKNAAYRINEWQLEKQHRIKPSLWWDEVAKAQAAKSTTDTTATTNQPVLSNLSADGKAWYLHPVGMEGFVIGEDYLITVELIEKITGKTGNWFNGKGSDKKFQEMFKATHPNVYQLDKENFVSLFNSCLQKYNITSPYHKAHFLSQCFHESANFESTLEFASGRGYDPGRHKNAIKHGNTEIGDGPKYRGRGLIQLTWKNNYKDYSLFKNIDFVSNPDLISQNMEYAIDVSCWFWRCHGGLYKKYNAKGDINILIDNEKNNVKLVTLAVNGGENGLQHRMNLFNAIKREWELK